MTAKDSAEEAYSQGVLALRSGLMGDAIDAWRRATDIDPLHESARYNLAVAMALRGDNDAAVSNYEKLLTINPAHREGLFNLANIMYRRGQLQTASALYGRLVDAHPRYAAGWINLAKSLSDSGELERSGVALKQAILLEPDNIVAHWNLSHVLLAEKKWLEAWKEYEWRLVLPEWMKPPVDAPAWNVNRKPGRVLLWNDQGVGDAIQFLRYPRFLVNLGFEPWLMVQDNLKRIASSVAGIAGVLGPSDPLPKFDYQAPLLSMPHLLSLPDPSMFVGTAYLKPERAMDLPKRPGRLAVGIAWAGNANFEKDEDRSAALSELMPLFSVPNIDWFSLQVGDASAQISECELSGCVLNLAACFNDFADTAAAIAALDLVISVDTAVAHLAGAMNVPCWLMLSDACDWRWRGEENSSVWYHSMRIFRQKNPKDWNSVAKEMAAELKKHNQSNSKSSD